MIRVFLTTFMLLIPAFGWAKSFQIDSINIVCDQTNICRRFEDKLGSLKKEILTPKKLQIRLKPYLFDRSIATFSYEVRNTHIGVVLKVDITSRKIINNISFELPAESINTSSLKNLLPYDENEYHNPGLDAEAEAKVSEFLINAGIADPMVTIELIPSDGIVDLKFKINYTKTILIKEIKINYIGNKDITSINNRLNDLKDTIYNKKEINIVTNEISNEIYEEGYFFSELELISPKFKNGDDGITLEFNLDLSVKVNLSFYGNRVASRSDLFSLVKENIRSMGTTLEPELIVKEIESFYRDRGIYYSKIKFSKREGKTKAGGVLHSYFFEIKEGSKIKISSLSFQGNRLVNNKVLKNLYQEKGTSLASSYFLDESFLAKFKQLIQEEYLKHGFISTKISDPIIEKQENSTNASVLYRIKESLICELKAIKYFRPVGEEVKAFISKALSNKVGSAFNILKLEEELKKILEVTRNNGYYFSQILNSEDRNLLKFSKDYKSVEIILDLDLGKKTYFNELQISGNIKSKDRVIQRESFFVTGDILKYSNVEFFKGRISSLGLFKTVKISPIIADSWKDEGEFKQSVNLLIEIKERDSITMAVGPGFRTDAGAKLSSRIRFLNIGGMNRRINLLANANYRISLQTLDEERRNKGLKLLEYRFRVDYEEPYFFHLPLEFDISGTASRNRYFSFDADIMTGTMAFSKDFSKSFSSSIKYQYDNIKQFNASSSKDEGNFVVGAITPSLTLDFRDNPGVARKGSWYGLSLEFANPGLGSINIENFEVNYLKILSRNKWYLKLAEKWGLAASLVFGWEKNFADDPLLNEDGDPRVVNGQVITKGYIPSVKVFRIEGIDIVRGFQETEINRLPNTGDDILNYFVNNTAYYSVFKFEARHYFKDSFVIAGFFDAGRVFVNKFNILDLRTSAGLSFKLLTPVGSLDLDFGVKLKRESYDDGDTDSFGRFHLLIGYF
ncbi:MAG: hypothetical protein DRQ88_02795 [Epsilonproteobacteria bacterium]|nr:MAG: hypothetical protein DRQ89_01750 [Campylobacterota bacterium]RLA67400.1 MAG: hypothetical protein DRQ88_02795 [Campylobacterota bacterium]